MRPTLRHRNVLHEAGNVAAAKMSASFASSHVPLSLLAHLMSKDSTPRYSRPGGRPNGREPQRNRAKPRIIWEVVNSDDPSDVLRAFLMLLGNERDLRHFRRLDSFLAQSDELSDSANPPHAG